MKSITEEFAIMMMDCAILAIGKITNADFLKEYKEQIEQVVREVFCNICEEHNIEKVELE